MKKTKLRWDRINALVISTTLLLICCSDWIQVLFFDKSFTMFGFITNIIFTMLGGFILEMTIQGSEHNEH